MSVETLRETVGAGVPTAPRWKRPSGGTWLIIAFGVVLAVLVLSPLLALGYGALLNAPPGTPGTLSLDAFSAAWTDPAAWSAIGTSLGLAVARMVVVMPIAVFLAWATTRTNMPLRRVMEGLIVSHIFLPFLPLVMAWAVLFSPRAGFVNVALRGLVGAPPGTTGPLDIFSYGGLIFLSALGIPTYLYLLIAPAFRSVDASLAGWARMSGASAMATLFKVTVPLLAPAIVGAGILSFVQALQSFEPELILGTPAGIYVFSTQIYRYINGTTTPQYGPATALSVLFLVATFTLVFAQTKLLGGRHFATVTGRGFQVQVLDLGRWRWLVFAGVLLFVLCSTIVPLVTLTLASLMRIYGLFNADWFTWSHYAGLLANPKLVPAIRNTLLLAAGSAFLTILITSVTSYISNRTRMAGRGLLDLLTWLPVTVPGIVLAVGLIWAYVGLVRLPFQLYGTVWMLILAVSVTMLPTGARTMSGTMVQIGAELEESARMHGASFLQTIRRVMLPLLTPAMLSCWLILFAFAVKNFVTVSVLYSPQSVVLSALQYEMWNGGQAEAASALGALNMLFSILLVVGYTVLMKRASRA
jgi:iron(III) transport system permease protein